MDKPYFCVGNKKTSPCLHLQNWKKFGDLPNNLYLDYQKNYTKYEKNFTRQAAMTCETCIISNQN